MRTNYNDSSGRNNGRYPKRQNNGGSGGGRRPSGSGSGGQNRRNPGQHSGNGSTNVAGMTSTRNKYLEMAKEALSNGNRVEAENYFQHAEHYSKMLGAAMATRREREESQDSSHRGNGNNTGNGNNNDRSSYTKPISMDAPIENEKPEMA